MPALQRLAPLSVVLLLALARPGLAQSPADSAALGRALRHYSELVARMADDSIAALYAPDGELAAPGRPPIVGPDSIRAFLHRFAAFHVLGEEMVADSLAFHGDTAVQAGRWRQRVRVPKGDTVNVSGDFAAEWLRDGQGSWRLRRMAARGS
jgi:ketosteroid isomerase-like protein